MSKQLGFDFFEVEPKQLELEGVRTKACKCCGKTYPETEQYFRPVQKNKTGEYSWYMAICKECQKTANRVVKQLKKTAPPMPDYCECCGEHKSKYRHSGLQLDHDHKTGEFRGWLCGACNRAIGGLGDDIQGVLKALAYLKRHYEKD